MIPLVVIRPEPGGSATVQAARAAGLEAHGFAMFTLAPRDWTPPDAREVDALLIGSAAAIRHGGEALEALRHLPVHAVGETTAQLARTAGFAVASIGSGGLQHMLETILPGTRLLRLAGEERVPLTPPRGVTLIERVVYASAPLPMPVALARLLTSQAVVLLHSGASARHFAAELDRLQIPRDHVHLAALAPRIAEAAGLGWASCQSAENPSDAALLALARQLCQTASEIRG
ncbi:MAG: uroporphyrinogen-III synthase [Novosphingobium sp.]